MTFLVFPAHLLVSAKPVNSASQPRIRVQELFASKNQ
jgi:hypothetical protein